MTGSLGLADGHGVAVDLHQILVDDDAVLEPGDAWRRIAGGQQAADGDVLSLQQGRDGGGRAVEGGRDAQHSQEARVGIEVGRCCGGHTGVGA